MGNELMKKSIWLPQESWEMIEKYRKKDARQSMSQFIDCAVKLYCCSLDSEKHEEVLGKEIINVIRANIKNAENHIASTIFKLAGEQATLNLLVADQIIGDIDDETIRAYRNDAYDIVRKRHGVFNFEDAIKNAEEIASGEED